MSFAPYEPPAHARDARPAVILWYRVYAVLMAVLSLVVFVIALGAHNYLGIVMAKVLLVFFGVAAFVPYKPWGWTMGLLAIGLGMAGGTALFAIPLLVFWMKPQVKAAFARLS